MQENIIGYLLGALDDDEMAEFEAAMESNEELQVRVQDAARSFQILGDDEDESGPPASLVESTMQRISATPSSRSRMTPARRELRNTDEAWSLFDVMVAAAVIFVGCMLFVPAIQGSRIHAQIAGCQNNLRNIGFALIDFSADNPHGAFPQIPQERKTGVAGIYAPILLESGYVAEDHNFYCPSLSNLDLVTANRIPRLEEIQIANGPRLARLQTACGGTYGYALGYFINDKLQCVRNEGRQHYAILADQPFCESQPTHQPLNHRNVLFEYGGVRLFPIKLQEWKGDRLFEDALGRVQAGVDKNDVVLGASATRPMPW